jgi:hypothetical protein
MGIARKLEDVRQALDPMTTQKDIAQFLNNTENAQKLNDLVDDIREAVMDYQVRTPQRTGSQSCLTSASDFLTTGYLQQHPSVNRKFLSNYLPIHSNRQTG